MTLVTKPFGDIITFTRASGGGRFNSSGVYEWVGNGVPRLDYDPVTLQPLGLLIEEQRTNLLLRSSNPGSWANSVLNGTANGAIGLDGAMSAFLTAADSDIGQHNIVIPADTSSYTLSIYVRPAVANVGKAFFTLTGINGVPGQASVTNAFYDFSTQTFGAGMVGWKAEPFGLFTRLTKTFQNNGSGTIFVVRMDNDPSAQIVLGGIQVEAGSFPTSYIPTEASQVTRAADVASVNTLSPWYNASEGALFVECSLLFTAIGGTNQHIAALSDGGFNNYLAVRKQNDGSIRAQSVVGGAIQFNAGTGAAVTDVRVAMSYKLNDFAASLNGGPAVLDAVGTVPLVNTLTIGRLPVAGQYLNGHIRSLSYWPRRLADSELQEITA